MSVSDQSPYASLAGQNATTYTARQDGIINTVLDNARERTEFEQSGEYVGFAPIREQGSDNLSKADLEGAKFLQDLQKLTPEQRQERLTTESQGLQSHINKLVNDTQTQIDAAKEGNFDAAKIPNGMSGEEYITQMEAVLTKAKGAQKSLEGVGTQDLSADELLVQYQEANLRFRIAEKSKEIAENSDFDKVQERGLKQELQAYHDLGHKFLEEKESVNASPAEELDKMLEQVQQNIKLTQAQLDKMTTLGQLEQRVELEVDMALYQEQAQRLQQGIEKNEELGNPDIAGRREEKLQARTQQLMGDAAEYVNDYTKEQELRESTRNGNLAAFKESVNDHYKNLIRTAPDSETADQLEADRKDLNKNLDARSTKYVDQLKHLHEYIDHVKVDGQQLSEEEKVDLKFEALLYTAEYDGPAESLGRDFLKDAGRADLMPASLAEAVAADKDLAKMGVSLDDLTNITITDKGLEVRGRGLLEGHTIENPELVEKIKQNGLDISGWRENDYRQLTNHASSGIDANNRVVIHGPIDSQLRVDSRTGSHNFNSVQNKVDTARLVDGFVSLGDSEKFNDIKDTRQAQLMAGAKRESLDKEVRDVSREIREFGKRHKVLDNAMNKLSPSDQQAFASTYRDIKQKSLQATQGNIAGIQSEAAKRHEKLGTTAEDLLGGKSDQDILNGFAANGGGNTAGQGNGALGDFAPDAAGGIMSDVSRTV